MKGENKKMNELGIGEALEKLIEVLQLEGHELLRIFTEVQPTIAICDMIVGISTIIGAILGVVVVHKIGKKRDWFCDCGEDDIIFVYLMIGVACGLVSLILSAGITQVYLRMNYPEYYAAKELISLLVP